MPDQRQKKLIFRAYRNTARVAANSISQEVVKLEREGQYFEEVAHLVKGQRGLEGYEVSDTDRGVWSAGMIQGLIYDVPGVSELVERIIEEAAAIITQRLAELVL
ncbi:hypothetical protein Q9K02_12455 [Qipengyuania sp. G39]|uniref:Nitronate monooxygenase domain-containing protein n=1 Tax=Qipengyuania profundimaris TaxID=3067652 RepID=A0ABT9HS42_9SPHN|nr:hypothetical protein [Qipengyuania sp. G39]MDP4575955.1 hypothetical protein [Qipengyuania sp. G39]